MTNKADYRAFIERKTQFSGDSGFNPLWMPDFLFDFQKSLVDWAVRKGRAAIFADCGLGKTAMELVWAENVVRRTGKPVLILEPLAVAAQTIKEAAKFGIEVKRSSDGSVPSKLTVTNYERLHRFSANDFCGVVLDESSILKSFDGVRRTEITAFMRKMPYRLLATATAAPNDYMELGTSSEALGYLGHVDMLNRFFRNDQNNVGQGRVYGSIQKWRFKGHAELPFWRWVCSWARACRKPSDIGCEDGPFVLPELTEREHLVEAKTLADGFLFELAAHTLAEQREERRRTINERCEKIAELVAHTGSPALVWCNLNDEGDLLEEMIPDAEQVSGDDSDEEKERILTDFAEGRRRVLVTKPKIGAWGLNLQICHHVTFFPTHSYEQYYQGVRRCWRFGQKHPVSVDVVCTEGELAVLRNLRRKAKQADEMFSRLTFEMNNALAIAKANDYTKKERLPTWLLKTS